MSAKKTANDIVKKIDPWSDMPSAKRKALYDDAQNAIVNFENSTLISYSDSDYAKARKKFAKFAVAMKRVESAWNDIGHDWLLIDEVDLETIDKLEDVIAFGHQLRAEAEANKTKVLDKDARLKRHAARLAYKLLTDHDLEPSATKKNSVYCQVAKLIYGDDLHRACRDHAAEQNEAKKAKN